MKTICAPSHVMREGRDLNQHGQAARHEQASSNSPVIFQETLASFFASAALANDARPQPIRTRVSDLIDVSVFIILLLCLMLWFWDPFITRNLFLQTPGWSSAKCANFTALTRARLPCIFRLWTSTYRGCWKTG